MDLLDVTQRQWNDLCDDYLARERAAREAGE